MYLWIVLASLQKAASIASVTVNFVFSAQKVVVDDNLWTCNFCFCVGLQGLLAFTRIKWIHFLDILVGICEFLLFVRLDGLD